MLNKVIGLVFTLNVYPPVLMAGSTLNELFISHQPYPPQTR
jgi:hypothetical protein